MKNSIIEMMKIVQRRAGQKGMYTSTHIVWITPPTYFMIGSVCFADQLCIYMFYWCAVDST